MTNINEVKTNFVKWYNNDCYTTVKYNFETFEDCYDDIDNDDYEIIVESFSDYFNYNCYEVYNIFSKL